MAEENPAGRAMLASAKKHIADKPMQFIDVPEWPDADGKPSRIWYRPMTVAENFDIFRYKADTGDARYSHAYAIIRRALDANGNQLFNLADEPALLELDVNAMMRVSSILISRSTVDEAKKG